MTLPVARIVVATSGSGASRQATEIAARLASAFAAPLTAVHDRIGPDGVSES